LLLFAQFFSHNSFSLTRTTWPGQQGIALGQQGVALGQQGVAMGNRGLPQVWVPQTRRWCPGQQGVPGTTGGANSSSFLHPDVCIAQDL